MGLNSLLDDLYQGAVLDHCRNPRNQARLEGADVVGHGANPFCGDEIDLQIRLDGSGRVSQVGVQGRGCAINRATGSMLTVAIQGKTLEQTEAMSASFSDMMRNDRSPLDSRVELGELGALSGVRRFPVRVKCALLAWWALEEGIEVFRAAHRSRGRREAPSEG